MNSKNSKTPKIVKDKLSNALLPILIDRAGEFLGPTLGTAIDPSYTDAEAPLNSRIVSVIGSRVLKTVCDPKLRAAIAPEEQDSFVQALIQSLIQTIGKKAW